MTDEKKPTEISFEKLGGRKIPDSVAETPEKSPDFSQIGGRCIFPAPDAPQESREDDDV
jgi:hypothetical protein